MKATRGWMSGLDWRLSSWRLDERNWVSHVPRGSWMLSGEVKSNRRPDEPSGLHGG